MSKIGVVTDSHSGITPEEATERGVFVVPAPFYIDGKSGLADLISEAGASGWFLGGDFVKFVYHGSYKGLNCAPSLHCSSCFLVVWVSCTCAGMPPWIRVLTIAAAIMIILSTLTTKQHTLIDVLTAVPLFLISRIFGILLTARYLIPVLTFIEK